LLLTPCAFGPGPINFMLGSTILHYQIIEKIGSGGMGEIYKARDPRLNRFVAIKVLNPSVSKDEDRRRRFFQEAQAASALNHPNIITIYDIIPDGPVECIVMEHVTGKSLAELIPAGGMSAPLVVRLGVQIASALNAAHTAAIVHRDLKPGNIMVTESARVKVLDFGLAKLLDSGPVAQSDDTRTVMGKPMTIEGSIIGTVSYMSPEQAQGKRIDARTDIFSFGTVLYEMATGKRAFEGENTLSTLTAVLRDETRPVADFVKDSPPEFDSIVRRCMRKNPEDRFQSMQDVEDALAVLKQAYDSGNLGGQPPSVIASTMSTPPFPPPPHDPNAPSQYGNPSSFHPDQPPFPQQNQPPSMAGPVNVDPSAYQQGAYPPPQPFNPPSYSPPPMQGPPPSMAPEPPKKKGLPIGAMIGVSVALIAAAGGGFWFLNKDKQKPVETPVAQNTPPPTAPTPAPTTPDPNAAPATPPAAETPAAPPPTTEKASDPKANQKTTQKAADPKATQKSAPPPPVEQKTAPKTEVKSPVSVPVPVPVPVPASAPTRSVPVPDGTPFSVTLADDIPNEAEEGMPLRFIASQDLKAGGAVVIAKGAAVTGAIFEGKKKKAFGIGGKMTLRMLQATMVDGRKVNVRATSGTRGDGPARRPVEVPGIKSKDFAAPKGSEYVAYIDGDVVVTVKQ